MICKKIKHIDLPLVLEFPLFLVAACFSVYASLFFFMFLYAFLCYPSAKKQVTPDLIIIILCFWFVLISFVSEGFWKEF
jgi:hypothetical protein